MSVRTNHLKPISIVGGLGQQCGSREVYRGTLSVRGNIYRHDTGLESVTKRKARRKISRLSPDAPITLATVAPSSWQARSRGKSVPPKLCEERMAGQQPAMDGQCCLPAPGMGGLGRQIEALFRLLRFLYPTNRLSFSTLRRYLPLYRKNGKGG